MKGFSESEKSTIRDRLILKGKELFGKNGIKGTSVEELARSVAIASGSFYLFFQSKEELYFEIVMREHKMMEEGIVQAFADTSNPEATLVQFMKSSIVGLEMNPIIRPMMNMEEIELLYRKLTPEQFIEVTGASFNTLIARVEDWKGKGILIDKPTRVLALMLSVHMHILNHKIELGEEYDAVMDQLISSIVKGILK